MHIQIAACISNMILFLSFFFCITFFFFKFTFFQRDFFSRFSFQFYFLIIFFFCFNFNIPAALTHCNTHLILLNRYIHVQKKWKLIIISGTKLSQVANFRTGTIQEHISNILFFNNKLYILLLLFNFFIL